MMQRMPKAQIAIENIPSGTKIYSDGTGISPLSTYATSIPITKGKYYMLITGSQVDDVIPTISSGATVINQGSQGRRLDYTTYYRYTLLKATGNSLIIYNPSTTYSIFNIIVVEL